MTCFQQLLIGCKIGIISLAEKYLYVCFGIIFLNQLPYDDLRVLYMLRTWSGISMMIAKVWIGCVDTR